MLSFGGDVLPGILGKHKLYIPRLVSSRPSKNGVNHGTSHLNTNDATSLSINVSTAQTRTRTNHIIVFDLPVSIHSLEDRQSACHWHPACRFGGPGEDGMRFGPDLVVWRYSISTSILLS
jgi:hypothetical protein